LEDLCLKKNNSPTFEQPQSVNFRPAWSRAAKKENLMTLKEILPGQSCFIQAIKAETLLGQRLLDLGLLPGSLVRVVRNAPLKDPVELELDGYLISMRREEAGCVMVEACHG
jgi:ferrous iron transport protein A